MAKKKIMGWSKCNGRIAKTPDDETMAKDTDLQSVGTIKDKSATLEPSDGDTLEAKATGGETVAKETQEGGYLLKLRIIEPDNDLYKFFGLGEEDTAGEEFKVTTHVIEGNYSVEIEPKNVGAVGIRAPKTNVAFKPGWSEEEGNYVDLEFEIIKTEPESGKGYWYSRFKKKAKTVAAD